MGASPLWSDEVPAWTRAGAPPPQSHSFQAPVLWLPQDAGLETGGSNRADGGLCGCGTHGEDMKAFLPVREPLG